MTNLSQRHLPEKVVWPEREEKMNVILSALIRGNLRVPDPRSLVCKVILASNLLETRIN